MSTVEQRAREAAEAWVNRHHGMQDSWWRAACVQSWLAGHADRATADQAALQAAHALLREVLEIGLSVDLFKRIEDHLAPASRGQEPTP